MGLLNEIYKNIGKIYYFLLPGLYNEDRNQKITLIYIFIVPLHFFTYLESGELDDSKYVTFSPVGDTASLYRTGLSSKQEQGKITDI